MQVLFLNPSRATEATSYDFYGGFWFVMGIKVFGGGGAGGFFLGGVRVKTM